MQVFYAFPPSFIFFYFIVFVSKSKASPELSLRSCGDQKKSYYHLRLAYMWTHDCTIGYIGASPEKEILVNSESINYTSLYTSRGLPSSSKETLGSFRDYDNT